MAIVTPTIHATHGAGPRPSRLHASLGMTRGPSGRDGRLPRNLLPAADARPPDGGQIARPPGPPDDDPDRPPDPSAAAGRRVFRSKVDDPAHLRLRGVSLAPGPTRSSLPTSSSARRSAAWICDPDPRGRHGRGGRSALRRRLAALGGLAILNLEGVQTRYDEPAVLARVAAAPEDAVHEVLAAAYAQPVREDLVARRIAEIHAAGSKAAVAATPGAARRFGPFCAEHGADLFLVQSQVSSARHLASGYDPLSLAEFTRFMPIPVAVGNTTTPPRSP